MDFSAEQRLAITNAIIELIDPSRNSNLVKERTRRSGRFNDNTVVVCEND